MEKDSAIYYNDFTTKWIPNYDNFLNQLLNILCDVEIQKVLMVGCGTGIEMKILAESLTNCSFTGVEPSSKVISIAKNKLKSLTNIELFEGNLEMYNRTTFFNAATLSLALNFLKYPKDRLDLLNQIGQRLKPRAPLIIMGVFGTNEQVRNNLDIFEQLLSNTIPQKELNNRCRRIRRELHRTSEKELKKLLSRSNFTEPTRFFQNSIYSAWITTKNDLRETEEGKVSKVYGNDVQNLKNLSFKFSAGCTQPFVVSSDGDASTRIV